MNVKNLNLILSYFHKNWLLIFFIGLTILGLYLRFYNLPLRVELGEDNGRDISIAKEALLRHELPLIGSFSSAGPFVFGPIYLWTLMFSFVLIPSFYAPWIILGLLEIITVAVSYLIGLRLGGKLSGLIIFFLAILSPQLVDSSTYLMQHSFVGLFSLLSLLFFILLWQVKKNIFSLFLGLSVGAAISFHYQAINLLVVLPFIFFIPQIKWPKKIFIVFLFFLGLFLTLMPLFIWDYQQKFANFRNILDYFLIAQYRIYVPNSWKLFMFSYAPNFLSYISGGNSLIFFYEFIIIIISGVLAWYKKSFNNILISIIFMFVLLLILNRYYRGERSEGYLYYFVPFVLISVGMSISYIFRYIYQINKRYYVAVAFLIISLLVIGVGDYLRMQKVPYSGISVTQRGDQIINSITSKFPGQKFSLYDYRAKSINTTAYLSVIMTDKNLLTENGVPIGVANIKDYTKVSLPIIFKNGEVYFVDLSSLHIKRTNKNWEKMNQADIYDTLIGWSNKHELTSTFDLNSYLLSKFK